MAKPLFFKESISALCFGAALLLAAFSVRADEAARSGLADVSPPDPALVARGEQLFRQCKWCHAVGPDARNRIGPHLNGVFGRTVGSVKGFAYSRGFEVLAAGGLVWNEVTLDAFLSRPRRLVPNTKMAYRGATRDDHRAALIAYMKTLR